jgi:hypothetical protein
MERAPRSFIRVEATDSQASILEQRLAELGTAISYQEEQHGPALVVCLRFKAEQENAVRRILSDVGLRSRGEEDDQLSES